jgi:hypothetical protein
LPHVAQTLFQGLQLTQTPGRSMEDVDGLRIAKSLYEEVFKGGTEYIDPDDIAYALDVAVRRLRDEVKDPMRWAPYIHLGI